jgi:hypothetical protein
MLAISCLYIDFFSGLFSMIDDLSIYFDNGKGFSGVFSGFSDFFWKKKIQEFHHRVTIHDR